MDLPLLYGSLTVSIHNANNLKNKDGKITGLFKKNKDLSDPYVRVALDKVKICKTQTIMDCLDPVWNEVFELQVNGRYHTLNFRVWDNDTGRPDSILGYVEIPLVEFIKSGGKLKDTLTLGPLPGHKTHGVYGTLSVSVKYTSNEDLLSSYEVPNVPFPLRSGCKVTLFQDAHIGSSAALLPEVKVQPTVRTVEVPDYKPTEGDSKESIEIKRRKRKKHKIARLRKHLKLDHDSDSEEERPGYLGKNYDDDDDEKVAHGIEHIFGIDDSPPDKVWTYKRRNCWEKIYKAILHAKYFVYITGWSVDTSISLIREKPIFKKGKPLDENDNGMLTIGELLKRKANEGVQVCLLLWNEATSVAGTKKEGMMCTHDELTKQYFQGTKVCCKLAYREGNIKSGNKLMWTHHQKSVILDSPALMSLTGKKPKKKRRIIAFVGGLDLCDGRWDTPAHPLYSTLDTYHKTDFHTVWPGITIDHGPREPWHDIHSKIEGPIARDVLRNFEQRWRKQASSHASVLLNFETLPFVSMQDEMLSDPLYWASYSVQLFRSIDKYSAIMENTGVKFDDSIHTAYVHHIRRAKRFIFIENQYFIGSAQAWINSEGNNVACNNLIPLELAERIVLAIKNNQRFAVYIILPMYPEGVPEDAAVQEILFWQHKTIQMMYSRIHTAIVECNLHGKVKPEDYLNFYCMGQRETVERVGNPFDKTTRPYQTILQKTKRFAIYVHSKMMIVDDDYIIVGSANINERSMNGRRDSEIAIGAYQPYYTSETCSDKPCGDIHAFRIGLWTSHVRRNSLYFLTPESLDCVKMINSIARENWEIFVGDKPADMNTKGHLLKYPLSISDYGTVVALPGRELIPDTKAPVVGCHSSMIPDIITL